MTCRLLAFCVAWAVCCASDIATASAADTAPVLPHRQDRPPNKPYSPQEALAKMTVPPGFHVDLIAAEPDIVNPVAMTFDDRGRLWVTESIEYPRKPAGVGKDRVKVIEGLTGDGKPAKVTIFAEGLNIPTGVAVGYGGVWVLNSPDLLFLREKDGKEISREVVVTGFGRTDFHELPSSLTWGPDGWLYGLNGVFNESKVIDKDGKRHDFNCALWRLHPRTREFQVISEGTSNPYGIAWDAEGSAIVEACHWANDHLFHFVETGHYQRQAGKFPAFAMPIGSITDHGHQKTAYCGIVNLDSDVFPAQYRERIVVGNIHGGCLNVDRLERDGATYLAKAEPDLLTANDVWFMPVSLKIGPDGCLYVLDWYDQYHCSQDAVRDPGVHRLRGRLYRLRYGEAPQPPKLDLATETDDQLIARLASGNLFFRESAQRLLNERLGSVSATVGSDSTTNLRGSLQRAALDPGAARKARLHALWSLIGGGPLDATFHKALFDHADPTFRAWAVRAAGNAGKVDPRIAAAVAKLARDPSPDVQLQVAIASSKMDGCDALAVLVDVLVHCGHDKLMPAIAWQNLHPLLETDAARFVRLLESAEQAGSAGAGPNSGTAKAASNSAPALPPAISTLMPRVIDRVLSARTPDPAIVVALLEHTRRREPGAMPSCIAAVSAKVGSLNDSTLAELKKQLQPMLEAALNDQSATPLRLSAQLLGARLGIGSVDAAAVRRTFASASEPEATRLQALDALIAFKDRPLLDSLPQVLSDAPPPFGARVLAALGRVEDPKLADLLLAQYPKLAPELQPLAVDLIMQREPWARKLLNAVLADKLPKGVLNANHLRKIMESDDREAIWAVEKAFGRVREERNPEREKVVAEMGQYLRQNPGDAVAGQRVFKSLCAQCHVIHGEGGRVGPDITANGRASFEQLLSNIFDPSLVIGPAYQVTTVVTKDGRNLTGLIAEDNDQRVVIRMPGEGEEAVPRNNVKYTRISRLSMMPEGIESLIPRKDLADLLAYLSFDKPPGDPTAKPIPGAPAPSAAPPAIPAASDARIKVDRATEHLNIKARLPGKDDWVDLATFVTDPASRPYLHPLRDATGRVVLTEDRPADHPWQHGIFTGFHQVNGFNYWKEDQGKQRFVKLLDLKESADRVSWRALVELVAPDGKVVIEEEDTITIHAPQSADAYQIDFDLLLRTKEKDVTFGKFFVGGLSVRMPWDKANPRQTHLNSEGQRNRDCEQKRAAWCNVERPFGNDGIHGIAIFDHPTNPSHPPGWRADEQGLINPNVSALADWSIQAGKEQRFRYRLLVYRGSATREGLAMTFKQFADERRPDTSPK